jgi:hypothetical protein
LSSIDAILSQTHFFLAGQCSDLVAKAKAEARADLQEGIQKVTAELRDSEKKLTATEKLVEEKEKALQAAQQLAGKASQLQQEVEAAKAAYEEAKQQYKELDRHHKTAVLPYWLKIATKEAVTKLGPTVNAFKATAGQAINNSYKTAKETGIPLIISTVKTSSLKASMLLEKYGGEKYLKVKKYTIEPASKAVGFAFNKTERIWNSEFVSSASSAAKSAFNEAEIKMKQVTMELETLVRTTLARWPNTTPLAREPYTYWIVYSLLAIPFVAISMPLLGMLISKPKAQQSSGTRGRRPQTTKKKGKK